MRGTILKAPSDVRYEERPDPTILEPTDAIVRTVAVCVCGSDLWPYRGIDQVTEPRPIGHEYCGIVEQVGDAVSGVQSGQFVVGGFGYSDNTCPSAGPAFRATASTVAATTDVSLS
jgi:threonine dehydrogenase-like Zn-dependent dehydrogenase